MEALLQQITSLRRALTKFGPAPHKPILLLAILESFDKGEIDRNWIGINEALLTRFYDLWHLLVNTANPPNFSLTFFHLGNERRGLWKLNAIPGKTIITTHKFSYKSIKLLKETFLGAQLSKEFYSALKSRLNRDTLKHALLNTYFPDSSVRKRETSERYSKKIEKQILFDTAENYAGDIIEHIHEESMESKEEELILRNYIFRKAVLDKYNNQCAITGLKIESPEEELLVDACHIVPFAQTSDDSILNGIALAPTLHRAFDNGLISISDNYKVLVHRKLKDFNAASGIRQYADKTLILPREKEFYPSVKRLSEHRVRFGYE
jgi:putative restriction endonuclease